MAVQRGYRQGCGVARGLDLVGERWSLLVVRELLLGPKRFAELQRALPSASPNALSDRLRELTAAGVLRRCTLSGVDGSRAYELTAWGRELEPIVIALGSWALRTPPTDEQVFVSPDSAMLTIRSYYTPTSDRREATIRVELDDRGPGSVFGVRLGADGADVTRVPPEHPDAVVVTTTSTLLRCLGAVRPEAWPVDGPLITGDHDAVHDLFAATRVPRPA